MNNPLLQDDAVPTRRSADRADHRRKNVSRPRQGDRCYDFLNIFDEQNCKKLAFSSQNKAKLCKIVIITLVFDKNAKFFTENRQKSQKIVIITSTPDWANFRPLGDCLPWAVF
jgi:hypothetical protein